MKVKWLLILLKSVDWLLNLLLLLDLSDLALLKHLLSEVSVSPLFDSHTTAVVMRINSPF